MNIPPHHDRSCWGCGDNPTGIHLPSPEREGARTYEARFSFGEQHQAGPGFVHGGLVAAALDEAAGLLATWYRFPSVTTKLAVRYRRPAHINRGLTIRAGLVADDGRRIDIEAELLDGEQSLAHAKGTWAHVPLEHFLQTPEGRAAGEAWRARLQGSP
ncbi:MAG TPA: PaaI family thioesterase [Gaiellaceae bacterium]|nr:PaaI family thioesterase [Gaiellaceae bacterium]